MGVDLLVQEQLVPYTIEDGHRRPPTGGGAALVEDRAIQEGEREAHSMGTVTVGSVFVVKEIVGGPRPNPLPLLARNKQRGATQTLPRRQVLAALRRRWKAGLADLEPGRVTIRANSAATLDLGMSPEGDLGMGSRQGDKLLEHWCYHDRVIVQEPDAFSASCEGSCGSEVAARAESRVVVGKNDQEVRVGTGESRLQSFPRTVVDDDCAMREGFVAGEGLQTAPSGSRVSEVHQNDGRRCWINGCWNVGQCSSQSVRN